VKKIRISKTNPVFVWRDRQFTDTQGSDGSCHCFVATSFTTQPGVVMLTFAIICRQHSIFAEESLRHQNDTGLKEVSLWKRIFWLYVPVFNTA